MHTQWDELTSFPFHVFAFAAVFVQLCILVHDQIFSILNTTWSCALDMSVERWRYEGGAQMSCISIGFFFKVSLLSDVACIDLSML